MAVIFTDGVAVGYRPPQSLLKTIFIKGSNPRNGQARRALVSGYVQRLRPGLWVTEATHRANRCLSTLSLCNANFTEVSLGNASWTEGRRARGQR